VIVAALYDIHGNLPALEAVLQEVGDSGADTILVGGDVAWGPWPRQTVERLEDLELPTIFVRGNADREVARASAPSSSSESALAEVTAWCGDQLAEEQRRWLDSLAPSVPLDVEGLGRTLFCHGSPRSDEEIITVLTPEARLAKALGNAPEETIVCGHTHMQFERHLFDKQIVNAGSVGLPYQQPSGAYWAQFGPGFELRRSDYDVRKTAEVMRLTGCPHVDHFFTSAITDPPSSNEVARQFEGF
jgi:predicted phosphodiesterase